MKKIILSFFIVFLLTDISVGEEKKGFEGMVFIKGGCFDMGYPFKDVKHNGDEKPVHKVCVDDFYLGEHEVTQEEWEEIMGNNPSFFINCGDDCPVDQVSYDDVQKYIRRLNNKTDLNYRLPTEAEWEYAARSGGRKEKYAGTSKKSDLGDYAWYLDNSGFETHPVKTKQPNFLGLYDMSGNVWEWVQDWYNRLYYKESPRNNPKGPNSGSNRVIRGGSWSFKPEDVRAAKRDWDDPSFGNFRIGFRLAIGVSGQN
jgi:formylglycine-generating enzyme required for sulfatase activity|tara:strand:+ start:662 stop:1429 length:768 start_codon:yes stop_codon:yes gene_type:complete